MFDYIWKWRKKNKFDNNKYKGLIWQFFKNKM